MEELLLLLIQIVPDVIIFAFFIFVGLYIAKRVGFVVAPILEGWLEGKEVKTHLKSILGISIVSGVLVGILIIGINFWLYTLEPILDPITLTRITPPVWQGFLASFYVGINEEIQMRLFLMTLLVWVFYKIKRTRESKPTDLGVWLAIIITVLSGVGYLLFTVVPFTGLTPSVVARAVVLYGITGIVFGWLYWKKGLESAMISHFSANIISNVISPLLLGRSYIFFY